MRSREEILRDAELLYRFHADCGEAPEKADLLLAAGSHDLRVVDCVFKEGESPLKESGNIELSGTLRRFSSRARRRG